MTDQPSGGWTTPPPAPQNPPRKQRSGAFKAGFLGCFGVLAAVVVVIIVIAVIAASGDKQATGTQATITSQPAAEPAATEPPANAPTPKDFTLTVKILSKQCFGSAGCNITFRVELSSNGVSPDPDKTYEVTYEVRGVEDGPQINTLTIEGGKYRADEEEFASTKSAATKLKAVITDVAEQ
jgi:hypothetical protein